MPKEIIARYCGTGRVLFREETIGSAEYNLVIYEEHIEGRTHSGPYRTSGGMRSVEGSLKYIGFPKLPAVANPILTLELEDGRKIEFYRSGGGVTFTGGLS